MKYVRTDSGVFEDEHVHIKVNTHTKTVVMEYKGKFYNPPMNVQQANTLEELICKDDLLIIENRHGKPPYKTFPLIYNEDVIFAYNSGSYRLKEWFIRDSDGNFKKVADGNEKGELKLYEL